MTTVNNPKVSPSSGKDENPKEQGFLNRSRASDKTLWDWLQLLGVLAIPLVVAGATLLFGIQQANLANQQHDNDQTIANQQHQADKQSALDQQEATTLQTYIDNIQDLLLNHKLLESKPGDEVAILARARTLTALRGLDPDRKGRLVQFIYEAQLIGFFDARIGKNNLHSSIIDLFHADLSGAYLNNAFLWGADLNHANLSGAYLNYAFLWGADLSIADLSYAHFIAANLYGANLSDADLSNADLSAAYLYDANLSGANLSGANLGATFINGNLIPANLRGANLSGTLLTSATITQKQLDQVKSCLNAILPPGLTCHHNS